jgi:hypothetical protein
MLNVDGWHRMHRFTKVEKVDGKSVQTFPDPVCEGNIRLFHYSLEKPQFPLSKYKYWTELLTSHAYYVFDATGVPEECKWRIEWKLPLEQASSLAIMQDARRSRFGRISEYQNKSPIESDCCEVFELR